MKKISIAAVLIVISFAVSAQQLGHYSQFFLNKYVINPAVAGTEGHFNVKSSYRYQWVGIDDAPRTFVLSMEGPFSKKQNMGLGGYVYSDITGPTRRTGIKLSYSYNFKITEDIKLSLGLAGGIMQFSVDGSDMQLANSNDEALGNVLTTAYTPDAAFGLFLYDKNWYFSLSIPQLIGTEMKFVDNHSNSLNKLENHYYANAGYTFNITDQWGVEPFVQLKYVPPINPQFDGGFRVIYDEDMWVGGTWRSEDGFSVFAGLNFLENFTFSYSYDVITSDVKDVSSGTHEILLGLRFHKPNQ